MRRTSKRRTRDGAPGTYRSRARRRGVPEAKSTGSKWRREPLASKAARRTSTRRAKNQPLHLAMRRSFVNLARIVLTGRWGERLTGWIQKERNQRQQDNSFKEFCCKGREKSGGREVESMV